MGGGGPRQMIQGDVFVMVLGGEEAVHLVEETEHKT